MDFCIVYISSATGLTDSELKELLNKSQENNRSLGITGILLYCNGSVIQVLEGKEDNVNYLYRVISRDRRHDNVMKLYSGKIEKRSFSDWLMGYKTISEKEMATLADEIPFINDPYQKSTSENAIMSLVKTFYKNNHRN